VDTTSASRISAEDEVEISKVTAVDTRETVVGTGVGCDVGCGVGSKVGSGVGLGEGRVLGLGVG
jgi:hypothetical protein